MHVYKNRPLPDDLLIPLKLYAPRTVNVFFAYVFWVFAILIFFELYNDWEKNADELFLPFILFLMPMCIVISYAAYKPPSLALDKDSLTIGSYLWFREKRFSWLEIDYIAKAKRERVGAHPTCELYMRGQVRKKICFSAEVHRDTDELVKKLNRYIQLYGAE